MTLHSRSIQSVCVFCGSADGIHEDYYRAADLMGETLGKAGIRLVYGAGKTGLMGAVADSALQAGGEVIGIVPENLNTEKLVHTGLSRIEVVSDIQIRKARMIELADAFIALPGGFGTFDELFEALTWAQIGLHNKPIGLLNTRKYFDSLMALVRQAAEEGFIYAEHQVLLVGASEPQDLIELLKSFEPPSGLNRWINRS